MLGVPSRVCLIGMFICIFSQLYFMAQALSFYESLYCVPVFQGYFIFISAAGGAAYFKELSDFTHIQTIMFPIGFAITLCGGAIVTLRSKKNTNKGGSAHQKENEAEGLFDDEDEEKEPSPSTERIKAAEAAEARASHGAQHRHTQESATTADFGLNGVAAALSSSDPPGLLAHGSPRGDRSFDSDSVAQRAPAVRSPPSAPVGAGGPDSMTRNHQHQRIMSSVCELLPTLLGFILRVCSFTSTNLSSLFRSNRVRSSAYANHNQRERRLASYAYNARMCTNASDSRLAIFLELARSLQA